MREVVGRLNIPDDQFNISKSTFQDFKACHSFISIYMKPSLQKLVI